jgi:uncharacterized protein YbcC (UPF0753/DUF2309 family)
MNEVADSVPREVINKTVVKLECLMDEASAKWTLPKRDDPIHTAFWQNRDLHRHATLFVRHMTAP